MHPSSITVAALIACALLLMYPPCTIIADDGDTDELVIPLARNTRLSIRPTLLGLVPPGDPTGYGEVFVRITAVGQDSLCLRYEIKEAVPQGDDEQTRIRRGEIQVTGLAVGMAFIPPLFWPDGGWETATGLLWLPRESFIALQDEGVSPWRFGFEDVSPTPGVEQVQARLEQLGANESALSLQASGEPVAYPCRVNGERTSVPAIRARDSLGLMECWILDDADNPLILKLNLLAPQPQEPYPSTAVGDPLGLIAAGAGYAVVDIDY